MFLIQVSGNSSSVPDAELTVSDIDCLSRPVDKIEVRYVRSPTDFNLSDRALTSNWLLVDMRAFVFILEGYNYKTTKAAFSDLSLVRFLTPK